MQVRLNGESKDCREGTSLFQLLEDLRIHPKTVVIELNRAIVRAPAYTSIILKDKDEVELVRFVGGGSVA